MSLAGFAHQRARLTLFLRWLRKKNIACEVPAND
jgi:hypothetical protein